MIRRLGPLAGKRILFGYDRYLTPELELYREVLSAQGELVEAVDHEHLHYLSSAELVSTAIQADPDAIGVLCCGTGMGMSIAANKYGGIYAARCTTVEDAELARTINNANVLCIAAKHGFPHNRAIIETFVHTPYAGRKLEELAYITELGGPTPTTSIASKRAVRRIA